MLLPSDWQLIPDMKRNIWSSYLNRLLCQCSVVKLRKKMWSRVPNDVPDESGIGRINPSPGIPRLHHYALDSHGTGDGNPEIPTLYPSVTSEPASGFLLHCLQCMSPVLSSAYQYQSGLRTNMFSRFMSILATLFATSGSGFSAITSGRISWEIYVKTRLW